MYGRNAREVAAVIQEVVDGASVDIVKGSSKSFEIIRVAGNGDETTLWSGKKLGPPRREKFPSADKVKELVV